MKKQIKRPLIVFAAGMVLVLASSVGATRAAIVYQNAAEQVDFSTSTLTVDLQEWQGDKYVSVNDGTLTFPSLQNSDGEYDFNIGQEYDEKVQVVNDSPGEYAEYVRVNVRKSWLSDGVKDTELDPDAIVLDIASGWIVDDVTTEGAIYYLTTPLEYNESAEFIEHIIIDNKIWDYVETVEKDGETGTVVNEYKYDNLSFYVELRVDAVQTHSADEAILGAWGVEAEFSGDTITSINGTTTVTE